MSEFDIVQNEPVEEQPVKEPKGIAKFLKTLGIVSAGSVVSFFETFIVTFLLAIFIWLFVATPHEVDGFSMEPNFHDKSFVVATKLSYKFAEPQRGDVVIVKITESKDYIKRVIGLPGERIMIYDCKVYINDKILDESEYLSKDKCTEGGNYLATSTDSKKVEITVPEGKYFLMGDNRTGSTDSRAFGPLSIDAIKGKAFFVISSKGDPRVFIVPDVKYED